MYHTSSLRTILRTTLVCSLLTVGLLVVGCDSGGSNGGSNGGSDPAWVGNWKQTEDGSTVFAISFTKDKVKEADAKGTCAVTTSDVTDISNGNEVTVETGSGERTQKLVVLDNGNMEVRNLDGSVFATYQPADDDKSVEEITGCT